MAVLSELGTNQIHERALALAPCRQAPRACAGAARKLGPPALIPDQESERIREWPDAARWHEQRRVVGHFAHRGDVAGDDRKRMRERFRVHDRVALAQARQGEDRRRRVAPRERDTPQRSVRVDAVAQPRRSAEGAHAFRVARIRVIANEIDRNTAEACYRGEERVHTLAECPVGNAEHTNAARARTRAERHAVTSRPNHRDGCPPNARLLELVGERRADRDDTICATCKDVRAAAHLRERDQAHPTRAKPLEVRRCERRRDRIDEHDPRAHRW